MAQRPHDPYSPFDAVPDKPKRTTTGKKPKPSDVTAGNRKQMVVDPAAAKETAAKKTAARKAPAKKTTRRRANKTTARKGRR